MSAHDAQAIGSMQAQERMKQLAPRDIAQDAMRRLNDRWIEVYEIAIKKGPHNPDGTSERAEQLARAWMSGFLRSRCRY